MIKTKGKTICMTSMKGGSGKTILTLLLAGMYQILEKKVLIIDMDLYNGGIALGLKVDPVKTIYNFTDDLSNNRYENFDDYVLTYSPFIDILSCPKDPRQAMKIDSKAIELIVNNAVYRYDVILIDTTHVLDKLNLTVMDSSDTLLYVLTNDMFHLKSAKSLMAILKDIEKENVKVLLNGTVFPEREYFSHFDIKNILNRKIDYTLGRTLHLRNIETYLMDGTLLNVLKRKEKEIDKLKKMAKDLIEE